MSETYINSSNIELQHVLYATGHVPERPFTGPFEVLAEDIVPGDVLRFLHNDDERVNTDTGKGFGLVLATRDQHFDFLHIAPKSEYFHGLADTASYADKGLSPVRMPHTGQEVWSASKHTQSTGAHVSPRILEGDLAFQILRNFQSISDLQRQHDAVPIDRKLDSFALEALLRYAVYRKATSLYQYDIKHT